jgi:hypothetical protein
VREIPLSNSEAVAVVDDWRYEELRPFVWCLHEKGYAYGWVNGKPMKMHRLVADVVPGQEVDHKNGDKLDNRESNLRPATRSQNLANRDKREGCSSRFKGVCWDKRAGKWMAYAVVDGKQKFLGYFVYDEEEEAARTYDLKALEVFGEFALLNFPREDYELRRAA